MSNYIFGFEELENNLHPALQRRLFLYLRKIAVDTGCKFFITTHSNVVIDLFFNDEEAQILHVVHDGRSATVKQVTSYLHHKNILDDLDVRASDILQSNCIVWVEGPSDRIYFNRWIELLTNGKLQEGVHYQCVFYGGRLLAHLSATAPEDHSEDLIKLLRINHNAIILIDSDKRAKTDNINTTKQRILAEIMEVDGIGWVTAGKEIENYIPVEALRAHYNNVTLSELGQYHDIINYLNKIKAKEGNRFKQNKVFFADKVCQYITEQNIEGVLDLKERLTEVINQIKIWNKTKT